jgi:hypothetical protein
MTEINVLPLRPPSAGHQPRAHRRCPGGRADARPVDRARRRRRPLRTCCRVSRPRRALSWLFLHPELVHADEGVRVLALERIPEAQIDHALVCGKSRMVLLARGSTEVEAQKVQVVVS